MSRKIIISCAVTGAADHTHLNPAIPITTKQIANDRINHVLQHRVQDIMLNRIQSRAFFAALRNLHVLRALALYQRLLLFYSANVLLFKILLSMLFEQLCQQGR